MLGRPPISGEDAHVHHRAQGRVREDCVHELIFRRLELAGDGLRLAPVNKRHDRPNTRQSTPWTAGLTCPSPKSRPGGYREELEIAVSMFWEGWPMIE